MIPSMKLNTAAVTTSHPPHMSSAARTLAVLGVRRVNHRPATSPIRAAGSNQDACVPIDAVPNQIAASGPRSTTVT